MDQISSTLYVIYFIYQTWKLLLSVNKILAYLTNPSTYRLIVSKKCVHMSEEK